jgi:hypothetical protein
MAKSVRKSARTTPRKTARAATHGTVNIHAHLRTPLQNLKKEAAALKGSVAPHEQASLDELIGNINNLTMAAQANCTGSGWSRKFALAAMPTRKR